MVLALLVLVLAYFGYHTRDFRLDASADSLLLEGDKDLARFREVRKTYRSRDLLVVTFTPGRELFTAPSLKILKQLRDELRAVEGVFSITTVLDVPLLTSTDVPLAELASNVHTLENSELDLGRAEKEIRESHVYRELLLSADARTTALLLNMKDDERFNRLLEDRDALRAKRRAGTLGLQEQARLDRILVEYDAAHAALGERRHRDVESIRAILGRYRPHGVLHLGGVPMITNDMVAFIKNDLVVFGGGVLVFLVVVLSVIFARARWVALPLLSCFYAGLLMIGMLGLVGWKVTVISSNFLALMLIITISMNIHLTVRYRQLQRDFPEMSHPTRVATSVRRMVWPCLYTALTTIMGFSSLVFSGIKPVIDFGWMMSIGLGVTFITSFTLFPAALMVLGEPRAEDPGRPEFRFTTHLAQLTERYGTAILGVAGLVAVVSAVGISRLTVENSFIDYSARTPRSTRA